MIPLRTLAFITPFALAAVIDAQTARFSADVVTASAVNATLGAAGATTPLPAGPIAPSGAVIALLGGWSNLQNTAFARVEWAGSSTPTRLEYFVDHNCTASSTGQPVGAQCSRTDFLLQLSNSSPVAVSLQLRALVHSIGSATQSYVIDVGNDGSVELTESSPTQSISMPIVLGPTPLLVRLSGSVSLIGTGQAWVGLEVIAVPTANVITTQAILGCDPGHGHYVAPRFDGGVDLGFTAPLHLGNPRVLVLGLGLQPLTLPSPQLFPCLLLPRPDLLVFSPPSHRFTLALPSSVRPVTLWSQGVVLDPLALQTTNAMRSDAY